MNKKCAKCQQIKTLDEFYRKLSGKQAWCKQCVKVCQADRWKSRKIKAVELLGGKCKICGYDKNYAALDFHHVEKKDEDWIYWKRWKWAKVVVELKKCICVCKNCHTELHHPQRDKNLIKQDSANNWLNRVVEPTGICPECGIEVFGTKYCSMECSRYGSRKVSNRPSKEELIKLIAENNMCAIGKMFKVSDNSVRKWAKQYGILPS